jgi:hypothetical protein
MLETGKLIGTSHRMAWLQDASPSLSLFKEARYTRLLTELLFLSEIELNHWAGPGPVAVDMGLAVLAVSAQLAETTRHSWLSDEATWKLVDHCLKLTFSGLLIVLTMLCIYYW